LYHPGRNEQAPFEIMDILEKADADTSHTVMSQLERTIFTVDKFIQLAKHGRYLSLDHFGIDFQVTSKDVICNHSFKLITTAS